MTAQYLGDGNWKLMFDSKTEVVLQTSEIEEILEDMKDRIYDIDEDNEIVLYE